MKIRFTRRQLFHGAPGLVVAGGLATSSLSRARAEDDHDESEEIGPTEDLMREHGVLNRVLLVYDATSWTSATANRRY